MKESYRRDGSVVIFEDASWQVVAHADIRRTSATVPNSVQHGDAFELGAVS